MREIKFRAWDGYRMTKGRMMFNNSTGILIADDVIIMQYTGLKDKNGKEIYEGDIIEYEKQWWNKDSLPSDYRHREKVEWNTDASFAHFAAGDWTVEPEEVEIIGNIYENPELLSN